MGFLKVKESLNYVVAVIVFIVYHALWVAIYQSKGFQDELFNEKYFLLIYLLYPLLMYGVQGLFAGLFLHLIPERNRVGVWGFNLSRFIFLTGSILLITVWDQLYHYLNFPFPFHHLLFDRSSIKGLLFFLLGFSLLTCFQKKVIPITEKTPEAQ